MLLIKGYGSQNHSAQQYDDAEGIMIICVGYSVSEK